MAKELDYNLKVSKFKHWLGYCIHFQINSLWKGIKPTYPPNNGSNIITAVLLQGFDI